MLYLERWSRFARFLTESIVCVFVVVLLFAIVLISVTLPTAVYSLDEGGKNATKIELDAIPDVVFNNTFFAKGTLIDLSTGQQIRNATIKFTGNGSGSLSEALAGGVIFDDPDGVEVLHLTTGDPVCLVDVLCESISEFDVLRLSKDGTISFAHPPNGVALQIRGMETDTFFVEVIIANAPNGTDSSFFVESFGGHPEIANLNVATLGGIEKIRVVNITNDTPNPDDGFVSISNLTAFDPLVDPSIMYRVNFTNVEGKTYEKPLELHGGFFSSIGVSIAPSNATSEVTATFEGDDYYNSTSATVYFHTTPSIFESGIFADGVFTEEESDEDSESGVLGETSGTTPISYSGTEYTSIDCATGDNDGDGLCNSWEGATGGITYGSGGSQATYQLKITSDPYRGGLLVYSDINKKDIFLELDYMTKHRPDDAAIQKVVDAFDSAGIELYVVVDDGDEFGHIANFQIWRDSTSNPDDDLDDFLDVKKKKGTYPNVVGPGLGTDSERNPIGKSDTYVTNLLNAKAQAYHYGLFVHSILGSCGPSGHAERPGNDLLVALGCGFSGNVAGHSGTNYSVGSTDEQAGTLMHELGHNLNLRHGGNVDMNCKANYQSVMSYSRQLPYYFDQGDPWILDYSRMDLTTLDELDDTSMPELHESSITSAPESGQPERYLVWAKPSASHGTERVVSSIGTDWDLDNDGTSFEMNMSQDLNNFGIKGCGLAADGTNNADPAEIEYGYDDWANMQFNFRPAAGSGFDGMAGPINELDPKVRLEILQMTRNVIVESYSTNRPLANREPVIVSGSTNNAAGEGHTVNLYWGDSAMQPGIEVRSDGTWGPVQHVYTSLSLFKNPHPVIAELINGTTQKPIALSNAFSVTVVPVPEDGNPQWFWISLGLIAIIVGLVVYIVWLKWLKKIYLERSRGPAVLGVDGKKNKEEKND